MSLSATPCISLAIEQLVAAGSDHYAVWVLSSPYPGGHVHHDLQWPEGLKQCWQSWQAMFSVRETASGPQVIAVYDPKDLLLAEQAALGGDSEGADLAKGYGGRLMQYLGVELWRWLFAGPVQSSFDQSLGIAMGQGKPLRIRLDVRSPNFIELPWEIMQPQPGKPPISMNPALLFSRTTNDVDPLTSIRPGHELRILLVLGRKSADPSLLDEALDSEVSSGSELGSELGPELDLEEEAATLTRLFENCGHDVAIGGHSPAPACRVKVLIQPSPAALVEELETRYYNVFFYAGHGQSAPDGGLLFLNDNCSINGTELAQVLTRCRVTLAVFNACWGAQPDHVENRLVPRSSLAEVLIHHGVPAVLGMRDAIADHEALSFIQTFTQSLLERLPIDQAAMNARQRLLALYQFNQPAWTLPVLYMHPEFSGQLLEPLEIFTILPEDSQTRITNLSRKAYLRPLQPPFQPVLIRDGFARIGREQANDFRIGEQWVSSRHAEIFCREAITPTAAPTYYIRDFSRYGTLIRAGDDWYRIHHQEVPLLPKTQLKFGSQQGQSYEFILEDAGTPKHN